MEKRPRPFTAERRFAEISGKAGAGGLDVTDSGDDRPGRDLLHGPQDEGAGGSISQADIDAMFD